MSIGQLVTADAVLLDLRPARVPTRMLSTLLDLLIVVAIGVGTYAITQGLGGSEALQQGLGIASSLIFSFGYMTAMETLNRGRTVGALALGLRAVRDDGGAVRFRQALVRSLAFWFIDFAPWTGFCGGLFCAAVNGQGKRIGDLLAGTVVIRVRVPRRPGLPDPSAVVITRPPGVPAPKRGSEDDRRERATRAAALAALAGWAETAEMSRLDDELTNACRLFVARAGRMLEYPRDQLAYALARQVAARVAPAPPPGTPPLDFLAAVVGERRRREQQRVAARPGWVPSAAELPSGWR